MSCSLSRSGSAATVRCHRAEVVTRAAGALADAGDLPPGLVVLVADDDGVLLATRDADSGIGPFDVETVCARLLDLSPPKGPAAAVVVSLDPSFDAESPAVAQAWRDMCRRFERADAMLVDWLLVTGTSRTSVGAAHSGFVS